MKKSIFTPLDNELKEAFGKSFGSYSNCYGRNNPEHFNGICRFCDTYNGRIRVAYKVLDVINEYRKVKVDKAKFMTIVCNFAEKNGLKAICRQYNSALMISVIGNK